MPTPAKSPEDRSGHHAAPQQLGAAVVLPPPPAPAGLGVGLRRRWVALWSSPVAQMLDPATDGPVLARLFELYRLGDDLAAVLARDSRAEKAAARRIRAAVADGDLDRAAAVAAELEVVRKAYNSTVGARVRVATEVRMLEAQLGLSPRSRLALGVMLMAGRKAMAEASADGDDDDDY